MSLFSLCATEVYLLTVSSRCIYRKYIFVILVWSKVPTIAFLGFPGGSAGKESACNAGDLDLTPGLERSPGEGKGYSLQYSGLENSMDCIVRGVAKSRTRLSDFHFHFTTIILICSYNNKWCEESLGCSLEKRQWREKELTQSLMGTDPGNLCHTWTWASRHTSGIWPSNYFSVCAKLFSSFTGKLQLLQSTAFFGIMFYNLKIFPNPPHL